jgi:hypothetical protein
MLTKKITTMKTSLVEFAKLVADLASDPDDGTKADALLAANDRLMALSKRYAPIDRDEDLQMVLVRRKLARLYDEYEGTAKTAEAEHALPMPAEIYHGKLSELAGRIAWLEGLIGEFEEERGY